MRSAVLILGVGAFGWYLWRQQATSVEQAKTTSAPGLLAPAIKNPWDEKLPGAWDQQSWPRGVSKITPDYYYNPIPAGVYYPVPVVRQQLRPL